MFSIQSICENSEQHQFTFVVNRCQSKDINVVNVNIFCVQHSPMNSTKKEMKTHPLHQKGDGIVT